MKCPYCNKEIDVHKTSEIREKKVLSEISRKTHSISTLSKKLDINRSTLRYYINNLLIKGKIKKKRTQNLAGRPIRLAIK